MKYEALSEAGAEVMEEEGHEKTHVNLSIGILRATGLKVWFLSALRYLLCSAVAGAVDQCAQTSPNQAKQLAAG